MKFNLLFLMLFVGLFAQAQPDLSAHLLRGSWQSYTTNPAMLPAGKLTLSLPGIYNNLLVTNITLNDLIKEQPDGSTVLDVNNAIAQLKTSNVLRENLDVETIGLGIKLGSLALTFGHRLRFNAFFDYPQTLPQLVWQGNAQFIGETVDFGPDIDLFGYHELALGLGYSLLNDRLSLGARAKLLSGGASLETSRRNLKLTTGADAYDLQVDADFVLNSSGALQYESLTDIGINFDFGSLSGQDVFSGNTGVAFDLGLSLNLNKLQLSFSALDLGGSITWDNAPTNYSLQGTYTYEGLDIAQDFLEDSTSWANVADTLEALYTPTETTLAYTTQVGSKYYLSGQYQLSQKLRLGALLFAENYREDFNPAFAFTADWQLLPVLRLGTLVGWRNEEIGNVGLNASLQLGPVWILAATDNVISAFVPKDSNSANFRLGVNFIFGQTQP